MGRNIHAIALVLFFLLLPEGAVSHNEPVDEWRWAPVVVERYEVSAQGAVRSYVGEIWIEMKLQLHWNYGEVPDSQILTTSEILRGRGDPKRHRHNWNCVDTGGLFNTSCSGGWQFDPESGYSMVDWNWVAGLRASHADDAVYHWDYRYWFIHPSWPNEPISVPLEGADRFTSAPFDCSNDDCHWVNTPPPPGADPRVSGGD